MNNILKKVVKSEKYQITHVTIKKSLEECMSKTMARYTRYNIIW